MMAADEPFISEYVSVAVSTIDIEHLVQWAVQQSGRLPWSRDGEDELAFDHGLTAKLRRRPKIGWGTAQVTAGLWRKGKPLPSSVKPVGDVGTVLEAIKRLPPEMASVVLVCARSGIRPDCMADVEPKRITKMVYPRKRGKRRGRHVPRVVTVWDIDPATVTAARRNYELWHVGLTLLLQIEPELTRWRLSGFNAPESPWKKTLEMGIF